MEGGSGGIAAALRQMQERRERRSCAGRRLDLVPSGRRQHVRGDAQIHAKGAACGCLVTDIDLTLDRRSKNVVHATADNVVITQDSPGRST
jgi:hypothetical protein